MKIARTKADMKRVVDQWKNAAPELESFRQKELAEFDNKKSWPLVDALLDEPYGTPEDGEGNGLVEIQKWFIKLARQQGLLPNVVKEDGVPYRVKKARRQ